ncbi:hypothetical protein K7X08_023853 [Anisodus acutangulus]|uniref:Ubiquitin-specific protease family C19-related protein n=1 Tax=Anisodus acutangulus TaxID=402998 RepID=A0A9Q1REF6_9SOLA|nr:hypothetical protein K7X08_023853 [Anisodus acutangulus]
MEGQRWFLLFREYANNSTDCHCNSVSQDLYSWEKDSMGSRFPSHQLSNGLFVSGRPEQPKERTPTMTSAPMPYTGGDIKKSGELGKMFDIPVDGSKSRKSGPITGAPSRSGLYTGASSHSGPISSGTAARTSYSTSGPISSSGLPGSVSTKKSNSGPLSKHGEPIKKSSGPQSGGVTPTGRQHSGPQAPVLPATGLITSGPISSGPLNSSGAPRKVSGPLDSMGSAKIHGPSVVNSQAVTTLSQNDVYSFKRSFPKPILWAMILLFVMGFIAGGFILGAVHNAILLIVVVVLFGIVAALFVWNSCWGGSAIVGFITRYPDSELRTAKNGQYVKVSGVVTCGNVPLESSFQKVLRCVYTSTSLYEYRGWDSKAANPTHRRFTWGLRSSERHVVDFYISDFQSGLRALVKTGYGAKVTPYVDESIIVDVDPLNSELSPEFIRWLRERNLSSDDRIMRLKEGYIKEGSTVSVIGVVQRNENMLLIVPPPDPFTTGCQWLKCIFPASLEGIVLRCEDALKVDAIPV